MGLQAGSLPGGLAGPSARWRSRSSRSAGRSCSRTQSTSAASGIWGAPSTSVPSARYPAGATGSHIVTGERPFSRNTRWKCVGCAVFGRPSVLSSASVPVDLRKTNQTSHQRLLKQFLFVLCLLYAAEQMRPDVISQ